ncbi:MAG TPA: ATP-binding protein [Gaiellaceae bacterium]|jgi:signal transduction histidine kinase/CheY-like chemotaxis protein|nr:ATP-binding protein [Gaiellaceae bacterium]
MSNEHILTTVVLAREQDVVFARQRARQLAQLLGLDGQDQVRVATAVSELARNALEYAGGGKVVYAVARDSSGLVVRVSDEGPGIAEHEKVLAGRFTSRTGMGVGIVGARRLMDSFDLRTSPGDGTTVTITKHLPRGTLLTNKARAEIVSNLAREDVAGPFGELQIQNQELMQALAELQVRRDELADMNRELDETNRGVVALYAELDERAEELRRTSDTKTRFLSSLSHELRTPLTSMLALCELLLNRVDGPLTDEQEHQVRFVHSGAESLLVLVNDLLDLARVAAGKTAVKPTEFEVDGFFGALRGMFRPLHQNESVALVFEPAAGVPVLNTDEAKLAQILRNLISNALKFTETGEVRVSCRVGGEDSVMFTVADTGIGISPDDRLQIFDEFVQIESALQAGVRGTGLGLAVCRRLAALLGGRLDVESESGVGSTFTVEIPVVYSPSDEAEEIDHTADLAPHAANMKSALVIDDDEAARYLAGRTLRSLGFDVSEAADGVRGLDVARERRPNLIVLDLKMPELDGFVVLQELKLDFRTAEIPVVIQTAKPVTARERSLLSEAAAILDKREAGRGSLARIVEGLVGGG